MKYPNIDTYQNTRIALGGANTVRSTLQGVGRTSAESGTPLPVTITSANVSKSNGSATVSVSFQSNPSDQSLAQVAFWVKGYLGNSQPIKIVEGASSPINFSLKATGENAVVVAQSIGKNGSLLPLAQCPSKGILL